MPFKNVLRKALKSIIHLPRAENVARVRKRLRHRAAHRVRRHGGSAHGVHPLRLVGLRKTVEALQKRRFVRRAKPLGLGVGSDAHAADGAVSDAHGEHYIAAVAAADQFVDIADSLAAFIQRRVDALDGVVAACVRLHGFKGVIADDGDARAVGLEALVQGDGLLGKRR